MNAVPATTEKYTSLSPSPLSGGRRHLKKVSAKTIKRTLRRLGMKAKGRVVLKGGTTDPEMKKEEPVPTTPTAGRRRRGTKKTHRRGRKSLFGLRY